MAHFLPVRIPVRAAATEDETEAPLFKIYQPAAQSDCARPSYLPTSRNQGVSVRHPCAQRCPPAGSARANEDKRPRRLFIGLNSLQKGSENLMAVYCRAAGQMVCSELPTRGA